MDAVTDGKTVLRRSMAGWIGGLFVTLLIGTMAAGFAILGTALVFSGSWPMGLGILILSAWTMVLTNYVWRDCRAKRGWQIEIEPGELHLDLPAGRSLMEAGRRERRFLEVSDVAAIETRLEAFRSFGMVNMQRNYGLRLKSGELIVLGEDRGLGTALDNESVGRMIETIAVKTGLPLRDLGMIEGNGGFLGVLFTSVPRWDVASLPANRQAALWRRAALTGGAAGTILLTGLLLSAVL